MRSSPQTPSAEAAAIWLGEGSVAQTIDLKVQRQSAVVFGVYATTLSVPGQWMRVGEIAAVRCDNTGLAPANPVRKGNDNA